jgi:hypothetical protein
MSTARPFRTALRSAGLAVAVVAAAGAGLATAATAAAAPASPRPGFQVSSFSASSARVWWVAGAAASGRPVLLRTADAGRYWHQVSLPAAAAEADPRQGPAEISFRGDTRGIFAVAGRYWVTADSGSSWTTGPVTAAGVQQVAAGASGQAFVLQVGLRGEQLIRVDTATGVRTPVLSPAKLRTAFPSLAVSGSSVLVLSGKTVWRSLDNGHSFSRLTAPCHPVTGGIVSLAGPTAVAWCAQTSDDVGTGYVSTDTGRTWTSVARAVSVPGAAATTTGSGSTVLFGSADGGVTRDHDGTTWTSARSLGHVRWLGTTSCSQAFAIAGNTETGLFHSVDGGRRWTAVRLG